MNNTHLIYVFCLILSSLSASACSALTADTNTMQKLLQMKSDELQIQSLKLAKLELELRDLRHKSLERGKKREKFDEIKRKIERQAKLLERIDANDFNLIVPVFDLPFSVGQIGRFGDVILKKLEDGSFVHPQNLKVISIIDEENVISDFCITAIFRDSLGPRESETLIGHRRGRYEPVYRTIWLRGVSTAGLVSDSSIRPSGIFIISGTEDYLTPIGAKQTVFVFEPLVIDTNNL
jgi:hypothetical protein